MRAMRSARFDERLRATVVARRPMRYAAGADPATDRPTHVRAGSGCALIADRLFVVQDDASFVAVVDPTDGSAAAIALPAGPGGARQFDDGRGNKKDKLDFEACFAVDAGRLVALGSGSTPARTRVLDLALPSGMPRLVELRGFYDALKACDAFADAGDDPSPRGRAVINPSPRGRAVINVEGACLVADGGTLRLFQRGNGQDGVDATCDVPLADFLAHLEGRAPPPPPANVVRYDLGRAGGGRLTFTDAAVMRTAGTAGPRGEGSSVIYLAAAEDCPDVTRDGPVTGVAVGVIEAAGTVRYTLLTDARGQPVLDKAEGIALFGDDRGYVVIDRDDPAAPSDLCTVQLSGPWNATALDKGAKM